MTIRGIMSLMNMPMTRGIILLMNVPMTRGIMSLINLPIMMRGMMIYFFKL